MTKIFIDTNIFLALYESGEDIPAIFTDLEKLAPRLVFPDIVFDEFVRNRDRILDYRARQIRTASIAGPEIPAFLHHFPAVLQIPQIAEEYNDCLLTLAGEIVAMIHKPPADPVYSALEALIRHPDVALIHRTRSHIDRARQRKLLGNPPKSEKKDTIGDELIWEMILDSVSEDLVVVTRDMTYRNHMTFLSHEYLERTGQELVIEHLISGALLRMGEVSGEALRRFEGTSSGEGE